MNWKTLVQFVALIYSIVALAYSLVAYINLNMYDPAILVTYSVISGVIILITSLYYMLGFNVPVKSYD